MSGQWTPSHPHATVKERVQRDWMMAMMNSPLVSPSFKVREGDDRLTVHPFNHVTTHPRTLHFHFSSLQHCFTSHHQVSENYTDGNPLFFQNLSSRVLKLLVSSYNCICIQFHPCCTCIIIHERGRQTDIQTHFPIPFSPLSLSFSLSLSLSLYLVS